MVKRTERGWAGHFISAHQCRFRRNTLLEFEDKKIIISSVGLLEYPYEEGFQTVNSFAYFETRIFHALSDNRWSDIDVNKEIFVDAPCHINIIDADDEANKMHDIVVLEIHNKLLKGEIK